MAPFKVPSFAELKTYTILERNGLIYLWHHSDQLEPDWQPPVLTQLSPNGGDWVYQGRNEYEVILLFLSILQLYYLCV